MKSRGRTRSLMRDPGCAAERRSPPQQLEGVRPLVAQEARDAPEDAEGLDGARRLGGPHVRGLPAELVEDARRVSLGAVVVAADEHRGLALLVLRLDHL